MPETPASAPRLGPGAAALAFAVRAWARLFGRSSLPEAEVRRRYACLAALIEREPRLVRWIRPIPEAPSCHLVLEFHHPQFRRYSGLEIVVINGRAPVYYGLPGAAKGGVGQVALGTYDVCIDVLDVGRRLYLTIEKSTPASFDIVRWSFTPPSDPGRHVLLEPGFPTADENFHVESTEAIFSWASWYLQSAEMGVLRWSAEDAEGILSVLEGCRGLDARIDDVIDRLVRLRATLARESQA